MDKVFAFLRAFSGFDVIYGNSTGEHPPPPFALNNVNGVYT